MRFLSFDEMVDDLLLHQLTEADKISIRKMASEAEVIELHETVGSDIRQMYFLWDPQNPVTMHNYTPIMDGLIDINPKHPENMSYRVVKAIWRRLQ